LGAGGQRQHPLHTRDAGEEAIREGRKLAEQERGELVIHGKDGRIREKDSHGNDPPDVPG
jgi:hypothetical protein